MCCYIKEQARIDIANHSIITNGKSTQHSDNDGNFATASDIELNGQACRNEQVE